MKSRWFFALLVLIVASSLLTAQSSYTHVPSDLAKAHLKDSRPPDYPALAEAARIQGNVILHVGIDTAGKVSSVKLVSGHPMLVGAAEAAVRQYKYSPFESNGQPVPVLTVVVVRFGNPASHDAEDPAKVAFQDRFWEAMDRAQAALRKSDATAAELALADANTLLAPTGPAPSNASERWTYLMSLGTLHRSQKRSSDAEQDFLQALELQKDKQDSAEAAASLDALGRLYYASGRLDARDKLNKAISIHQKSYKDATTPTAQAVYANAIAEDAWMLSRIALSQRDSEEAARQCRAVLEIRKALSENDLKVKDCETLAATPAVNAK